MDRESNSEFVLAALGFCIAGHEEVRQRDGRIEVQVERLEDHLGVQ